MGFWSAETQDLNRKSVEVFLEQLSQRLSQAVRQEISMHDATLFWQEGWDFWGGVPREMFDYIKSQEFRRQLLEARIE
jgi:hypothetical protein